MATVTTAQIQQIYIGFLGRAADKAGLDYWVNEITNDNLTLEQLRANITNEQAEYTDGYGQLSRGDLIDAVYQALFERAPDAAGKAYWETGDGAGVNADRLIQAFIDGASTDDQSVLDNKTEVAEYYTTSAGANYSAASAASTIADVDGGAGAVAAGKALVDTQFNQGTTFTLTDGRDNFVGSASNDTFDGLAGQNQDGAIANALATGDRIDGKDGVDTLEASIINDGTVDDGEVLSINARTTNLEKTFFEVLEEDVQVDAGRMDSVSEYWSDNSDEHLEINDVRLGSKLSVTKDITFGLRDADKDAGLKAAFDTQSLTNEGSTKADSQLLIRIADVSTETPAAPLTNVNMQLSFVLGGQSYNITDLKSTDGSYAGLVTALDTALDALGLTNVEAKLGEAYNQVTFAGNTVTLPFTANQILLNDPAGAEFGQVTFEQSAIQPVTGGFLVAGNAEPFDPSTSTTLIETNVILDNAGRGSTAGDVIIGGMSNSGKVIEKLNLMVDRDSKIDELTTAHAMENSSGNVTSGTQVAFEQIEVTSLTNDGDLSINEIGDAKLFNASAFEGENLTVSGDAQSAKAYSYTTAASKDSVTVDIDLDAEAAALHTFSIDTNTQGGDDTVEYTFNNETATSFLNSVQLSNVNINTGTGNDTVKLNDTLYNVGDVELGAGNDVVFVANNNATKEAWVFNADASGGSYVGRGNDAYKAFGIKLKVEFQGIESQLIEVKFDTAAYTTSAQAINDAIKAAIAGDDNLKNLLKVEDLRDNGLQITSAVDRELDEHALNVEFLAPKYNDGTVDVQNNTAGVYQNDTVDIFSARTIVSESDMEAAWAAWYPGSTGIGGGSAAAPYNVANAQALFTAMQSEIDSADVNSTAGLNAAADDDVDTDSNMDGTIATFNKLNVAQGSDGTETSIVEINGGSGDDLIVLSSSKAAGAGYATVELSAGFGNDTIVNFNTGNASVPGSTADVIDYTAFLDEVANARGDSASTVATNDMRIEQDVDYSFQNLVGAGATNAVVDHNKVITVDLSDLFAELVATAGDRPSNFEGVTAAMVERALNKVLDDSDYSSADITGESKQAGSQVVFNVVHDNHFEFDGTNVVMGDATDLTTQSVFTATVAYDASATDTTRNLSLTGMTKQGTIEFGDMYSTIADLTDASVKGTANQIAANTEVTTAISQRNDADQNIATSTTMTSFTAGDKYFIEAGVVLTASLTDLTTAVNAGVTFSGFGAISVTGTSQAAAELTALKAVATVTVGTSATTITGTATEVKALYDAGNVNGLGDEAVTLSDATLAAADLLAIDEDTSGVVTATAATAISGSIEDLKAVDTAFVAGTLTVQTADNLTVTDAAGTDIVATEFTALGSKYATVTVENEIDLTGTHLETATASAETASTVNAVISDTSLTATELATLDSATTGTITTDSGALAIGAVTNGGTVALTAATDTVDVSTLTDGQGITVTGMGSGDVLSVGVIAGLALGSTVTDNITADPVVMDLAVSNDGTDTTIEWELTDNGAANNDNTTASVTLTGVTLTDADFSFVQATGLLTLS